MRPLSDRLQALVLLQDIDLMIREARDPEIADHVGRLGLPAADLKGLERARRRAASQVDEPLLRTYERMSRKFPRVVVPVLGSVCQGCRMSLPTSSASRSAPPTSLENCQNCGRILYRF